MQQERTHLKHPSMLSGLTLALVLFLVSSCSASGWPFSGGATTGGRNPSKIHVGFVAETTSQNFAQEMMAGAQYAADQFHVKAQIVAPPNIDDPAAVALFQNLTQTARDGIAVQTLAPNLFVQPEADAVNQGIPLVAVDTLPLAGAHIKTYVGNDNLAAGKMLAQAAIERIPPSAQGSVVIGIDVPSVPVLINRSQGIKEEIQQARPNIQVLGPFESMQETRQNFDTWTNLIATYPNAVAYLGVGDPDNTSLAQIKQINHGTYLTGAFDLDEAALQAVANGTNFALVDPEHFLKGYIAMRLLIEHAMYGRAIPTGWWNPGALLVTQSNVQSIIARQSSLEAKEKFYQPIIDREFANPNAQIKPMNQVT
jgi:ABC-type sugar transport system substrate-binding protein